jgi:hypothetical protein
LSHGARHLGAIVCVATDKPRDAAFFREKLRGFSALSHLTVEVAKSGMERT